MGHVQPDRGKQLSLADYLASPIRTLCESVNDPQQDFISDHDVVEAYNVLCGRIRSRKSDISNMTTHATMSNFEKYVPLLVLCISRDILRVLPNPFESVRRRSERSITQSYDTIHEDNMPPALDHILCQNALRLMSDLFMYPTLYSMFTPSQISTLLQDALSLCMPTAFWAFDIEILRCIVLLMLKMQQLPLNLLRPDLTSMVNAVQSVINVQEATMSKFDGLAAISSLLQKYPILLLNFVPVLPSTLRDLKMDDLDARLLAAHVLSAFAVSKYNLLESSLPTSTFLEVAEFVQNYITNEHSKFPPPDDVLPLIVKSAISDNPRSFWKKKGPAFVISLVSAFAILLDFPVFTSPHSLKLVFSIIQTTAGSRWKRVAVHSEMWKILLWAFSRIPRKEDDLKDPIAKGQDLEGWNDTRERAYRVLKQEVRNGIGVAFVRILLHFEARGRRDNEDVGKAIEIIEDLMQCDGRTEKSDAVLLLERLMSGIGASLDCGEGDKRLRVEFSKELIDGSLVGKSFRDLAIRATTTPIGDIQPLSEAEAIRFWDRLSEIWRSSVEGFLSHFDDSLPQNMFEIWQALLLVQGQLTESHQHLTASASITSSVVFIVTQISSPLETPQAQARYLDTISELWTVMKNVFTKTWLPSPAERILASLLNKRFDLSNDTVRICWSRLCAELISVGIPTLLHVLHTKTSSPSQEEMDVPRRLWAVLAQKAGGMGHSTEDDWMNLVQLLVMPFGAWNMVDSEVEIWRMTLSRTVEAAASVSQPSHVVISVLLENLGGPKLDLLKSVPSVLNSLLSHLVSSPCINATLKLLSITDSVLHTSYPSFAECKTWALECLRLIAKLISQALDSENFQIITTMPHGLCRWIADEDAVLTDDEHRELVVIIYGESLKRLSTLEPSLDRLGTLANFLYSAFVRVQNDGLLSFEKFWRSTYHQHKNVSKKDYPLAIRACLKAWSDVCDDSFADDISLGSDSQSLESYIIPDSQPSPEKGNDSALVPPDETGVDHPGCENESSQGTVTPKTKRAVLSPPAVLSSNFISTQIASQAPRKAQRRRIEPHFSSPSLGQPSSDKGSRAQAIVSEPVTRVSTLSRLPPALNSQPLVEPHTRKRRPEDTSSWLGSDLKRQRRAMASSDDYDTWEQHVLTGEREIGHPSGDLADAGPASEDILSPSPRHLPVRSRKRDRSQTAPESESVAIPLAGQTLRRHQTSPLQGVGRETPAQLDALQRAYAIIADTGTSQISVQDIMHARRLANQINQVLDEQMCLTLGAAPQPDDSI